MITISNATGDVGQSAATSLTSHNDRVTRSRAMVTLWREGGWRVLSPYGLLATVVCTLLWMMIGYWAPAHGGTDQNGYLVTARLMAENQSLHFVPRDPFVFVGSMMIETEDGRVFAKYPPGYPFLAALARVVAGPMAMYWVNPLCTVLACVAAYWLFRVLLDSFCALIGVILLATNPLVLAYAHDSNSHASTLLCVTIGFWGLLHWIQKGSVWPALLGAGALGYAATIRYSELLLFLPVAFATLIMLGRSRQKVMASAGVLACWALPVGIMALICWISFGAPWKTGYSYCAEDTGFSLKYLFGDVAKNRPGHWETLLVQLNWMGLFMLWPLAIAGLLALLGFRWKVAATLLLWAVPTTVLYLAYYWAPEGETTTGYLRFYMSILPGLILAALWLLQRSMAGLGASRALALGTVAALAISVNLANILPNVEGGFASQFALAQAAGAVHDQIPTGGLLFVADESMANHLDAWGGFRLYNLSLFSSRSLGGLQQAVKDPLAQSEPDPRQRIRWQRYLDLVSRLDAAGRRLPESQDQLWRAQSLIMAEAIQQHQRVFFLLRTGQNRDWLPSGGVWASTLVATQAVYPNVLTIPRPIGGWNLAGRASFRDEMHPPRPVIWSLFEVTPSLGSSVPAQCD